MSIGNELRGAVDRGEIVAWFQPQVEVESGRVTAVEALARWQHPTRGLVSPVVFIPEAEDTGTIHEIGAHMLWEGCRHAARWRDRGFNVDVSVNVSAVQLAKPSVFAQLQDLLETFALPEGTLTIEITESQLIADLQEVATRLARLKSFGLGIALDDFGTGHSSLAQLQDLPITELKIDRSLIQATTSIGGELIALAVALLQERGVRVVAEGVETEEHLNRVRHLRCDRAQGYLFGRPMPVEEVDELLAHALA
ncbi:EAL domain-containing protein [Mycetocola miduiensis]|uniref:EAL domain, c-di-GMP-specific phosphodiesterase class I (Or its enzymatically inactive variant) n=1 Tax=Mycetocola miduiensis TaxID=995034 RepID=A0A1I4YBS8_9MICO|nr:EAL domain-containing protein [Mycetocola miduiensis]SFN35183.1 EAL domain, c-di-GMP-specific phosphodiesterase class I (or its enzymatically inactive variant) [Mycetocola miduiensis]